MTGCSQAGSEHRPYNRPVTGIYRERYERPSTHPHHTQCQQTQAVTKKLHKGSEPFIYILLL